MNTRLPYFVERADTAAEVEDRLTLPFEARQKTRQRVVLDSGREAGLKLPRGTLLRGGDRLRGEDGTIVEIIAAPEDVSTIRSDTPQLLARAAYHLGNRHVWVEVGTDCLCYLRDAVLDDMVAGIGLEVRHERRPFEPEGGAYHSHSGAHEHHGGHARG